MNGFKDFRAKLRESLDEQPAISRWEDMAFSMKFPISPRSFSVKRIMTSMALCVLAVDSGAWGLPGLVRMPAGLSDLDIVLGDQSLPTDINIGCRND